MAEPERAGDDEADHQCDDRLRINAHQVVPAGRLGEAGGLWQIIGKQRHGNAEDGVAQHFQPAHFEKTDLRHVPPYVTSLSLRGCTTRSRPVLASPVRRRPRFAQAMPDTLRPGGLRAAAPRVARQGVACQAVARGRKARRRLSASARQPSLASRVKAGAGGGTRTHTTLPSRDFKSLASTSSATSALLIPLAFSSQTGKCFPIEPLRFPFRIQNLFTPCPDGP